MRERDLPQGAAPEVADGAHSLHYFGLAEEDEEHVGQHDDRSKSGEAEGGQSEEVSKTAEVEHLLTKLLVKRGLPAREVT